MVLRASRRHGTLSPYRRQSSWRNMIRSRKFLSSLSYPLPPHDTQDRVLRSRTARSAIVGRGRLCLFLSLSLSLFVVNSRAWLIETGSARIPDVQPAVHSRKRIAASIFAWWARFRDSRETRCPSSFNKRFWRIAGECKTMYFWYFNVSLCLFQFR